MEYLGTGKAINKVKPLVSVIVTTYQHARFIESCLGGILEQQTDFCFEIILGEDQSDDGTRDICLHYAGKHTDMIRLFLRSRENVIRIAGTPTGRYNFMESIKAARGKYIALCEGDDYWTDPQKLQRQVDFLEANEDFAICFHKIVINKNGELVDDYITQAPAEIMTLADLMKTNYIHTPSVLFKNRLGEFPKWFAKAMPGDYPLWMLLTKNGEKIKYIDGVMAVYRAHDGGIWSMQNTKKYGQAISATFMFCAMEIGNMDAGYLREKLVSLANSVNNKGYCDISRWQYFLLACWATKKLQMDFLQKIKFLFPRLSNISKKFIISLKHRLGVLLSR